MASCGRSKLERMASWSMTLEWSTQCKRSQCLHILTRMGHGSFLCIARHCKCSSELCRCSSELCLRHVVLNLGQENILSCKLIIFEFLITYVSVTDAANKQDFIRILYSPLMSRIIISWRSLCTGCSLIYTRLSENLINC